MVTSWVHFFLQALKQRLPDIHVQVCKTGLLLPSRACHGKTKRANLTGTSIFSLDCAVWHDWRVFLHQLEVRNERVHEVWRLLAGVSKHLVTSLFLTVLGGSQRVRSLHWTRPSDILGEETELFSVLVQGGGCTPLFSYSLHMREWTLKLNWPDVPSLFHPSFTHPTSSLCSPGSHSVPLSWGNIFSCWDGGKGTRYRDKLAFYKLHQSSHWTRYVSWFSFCFLYIIFVCVCVWFPWQWLSRNYILMACWN